MYIKLTNDAPEIYTIGQLRRDNPNVSFPKDIREETLAEYNVYKVKQTPAPETDSKTHRQVQTVNLVDGEWTQVWKTVELPLSQAAENIRGHRNRLLSNSDWTQVSDAPVDQDAWATYRQALRDITNQEGFPYNVTWPTNPE